MAYAAVDNMVQFLSIININASMRNAWISQGIDEDWRAGLATNYHPGSNDVVLLAYQHIPKHPLCF